MSATEKTVSTSVPASLEAEQAVLGALLLDETAIDVAAQFLQPKHFYDSRHAQIYQVILDLHAKHMAVDLTTVVDELKDRKLLATVGGPAYLAALPMQVFSPANVEYYARIVHEKYQLRELVRVAEQIQEHVLQKDEDVQAVIELAENNLYAISQERRVRDFVDVGSLISEVVDEIEARSRQSHEITGVETGYPDLDAMTGGLQRSDLIILAARPAMGKTAFALNIVVRVGTGLRGKRIESELQRPVGVFSLEMSYQQVTQRLLATLAEVSMFRMRNGRLSKREKEKIHSAAKILATAPIHIDDTPNISIAELRSKARRLKSREPNLSLLVVDYLQLMHSGGRIENRQQEVAEITRSLKALARELDLPIIALSQLSRQIEQRRGKKQARPMLSDLRESGAIEQDADIVMFIHREMGKTEREEEDGAENMGQEATLIIGKHRNGPTGDIRLVFFKDIATFQSLSRDLPPDDVGY
ncbi:MAG: replicative DNA helicase [Candidatus Sumerlaea chitinivorans]|nr:replicative DNA helicase [Candidatus Sumerlaea chitinivorans]